MMSSKLLKFIEFNVITHRKLLHSSFITMAIEGEKYTHYGFELVKEEEKKGKVHDMFASISPVYDRMNDFMSFGIHRLWKNTFIHCLNPQPGTKLLDVAGGSGDIGFRFLDFISKHTTPNSSQVQSHVTVSDINQAMLDVGKKRAEQFGYIDDSKISWLLADAENLPIESDTFDAYTISFGIRNVTHIGKALDEAYRVLKPGGRFLCLEFSRVHNPVLSKLYDIYSFSVIPVIGQVVAGDYKSYQYLVESIRKFPDQETLKKMIEDAGFSSVTYQNLTFGTVAIHSGFKL